VKQEDAIRDKVAAAKERLAAAEGSLDKAIAALHAMPRAEKVTVGTVVEAAFDELKAAKSSLDDVEALLDGKDP